MKQEKEQSLLIFIGALPPPVHGASLVSEAILDNLKRRHINIDVVDTSPSTLNRTGIYYLKRLRSTLLGLLKIIRASADGKKVRIYISMAGGSGKIFDLAFVVLGRIISAHLFLHHHSFSYINKPSLLSLYIFRIAGYRTTNIFLCQHMADLTMQQYHLTRQGRILSNMPILLGAQLAATVKLSAPTSINFFSNISREKGIYDFLKVADRLRERYPHLRFVVAGPFQDSTVEAFVLAKHASGCVNYVGPKYGEEKLEFFKSMDVLVFPSENEAEPVTILEALFSGVPVIANSVGCVPSILSMNEGFVVPRGDDFVEQASQKIEEWLRDPNCYVRTSHQAIEGARQLLKDGQASYDSLLDELSGIVEGEKLE